MRVCESHTHDSAYTLTCTRHQTPSTKHMHSTNLVLQIHERRCRLVAALLDLREHELHDLGLVAERRLVQRTVAVLDSRINQMVSYTAAAT